MPAACPAPLMGVGVVPDGRKMEEDGSAVLVRFVHYEFMDGGGGVGCGGILCL